MRRRDLVFEDVDVLVLAVRQVGVLGRDERVVEELLLQGEVRIEVVNQVRVSGAELRVLLPLPRAVAPPVDRHALYGARVEHEPDRQVAADGLRTADRQVADDLRRAATDFRVRDQIVVHRLRNTRDDRELPERNVVAVRVLRPIEALRERLIVRGDRALDGRRRVGLEIADLAVPVQVEVGQRLAREILAVVDQVLIDTVHVGAGGHRVLQLRAGLETERPYEVVDTGAGLQVFLFYRHLLDERVGILDQSEDVKARVLVQNVIRPAHAEGRLASVVGTHDALDETLLVRQIAADFRAAGLRDHVHIPADGSHAINR